MFDLGKLGGATSKFPSAPASSNSLFQNLGGRLAGTAPEMAGNTVSDQARQNYNNLSKMGQQQPAQFSPVQFGGAQGDPLSQFIQSLLKKG